MSGLPAEVLKQIKGIQLKTSHLVSSVLAGQYESAFKGRGMEFSEVREYQPGDDVRAIDWNVTARMGAPFIKEFREERELTVMLLVDVSASGEFGTVRRMKNEVAAEFAAVLAYAAIKNQDKVGLVVFSDHVEKFIPPKKGRSHVWRVIREILTHETSHRRVGTRLDVALEFLSKVTARRTVTFLLSDFPADGSGRALQLGARRHDVVAVRIADPRESSLPAVGLVELEDAETGEVILVDTSDPAVREGFARLAGERDRALSQRLRRLEIDLVEIDTERPYVDALVRFFHKRERRIRR